MGRVIDISGKLAALQEAAGEPIVFIFKGAELTFPASVPFEMLVMFTKPAEAALAMENMLGPAGYAAFRATAPSASEFMALFEALCQEYGITPGESGASMTPSPSTPAPSRPTSLGSTASTLPPPSQS